MSDQDAFYMQAAKTRAVATDRTAYPIRFAPKSIAKLKRYYRYNATNSEIITVWQEKVL